MRDRVCIAGVFICVLAIAFLAGMAVSSGPLVPAEVIPELPGMLLQPQPYNLPVIYASWVIYYCDETGTPVWLASRMLDVESNGWRVHALSPAGAEGLAQIMPGNREEFSRLYNDGKPIDPFDPYTAIRVGIRHLAALHASTGSWRSAVAAYNCGLARWRTGWIPAETARHLKEVMGDAK